MAFATTNVTPSMGEWDIVDAYATDLQISSALLSDIVANTYLVKSISIDMHSTGKWFKIFDDAALVLGPVVNEIAHQWKQRYESPLVIKGALNVQTENNSVFHITVCYRKFPTS